MTLPEVEAELKAMGIIGVSLAETGRLIKKLADLKAENAKLSHERDKALKEVKYHRTTVDQCCDLLEKSGITEMGEGALVKGMPENIKRLVQNRDEAIVGQAAMVDEMKRVLGSVDTDLRNYGLPARAERKENERDEKTGTGIL